ncbi:MAG TPA: protein kinase, partial [Fimbriiglobus sp.]|nr:protein kinase [Fimbriiglobus sp.]
VWLARQQEPVKRLVAVKVIKAGMDTAQVVARFEAERQALALMDHPNIAKVLDGGATPSGRPYFVMELVKSVPITEFCDHNHLTPRQRLPLGLEPGQHLPRVHAGLDQLECDQPLDRLGLLRHPDAAHAALADRLDQLVRADDRAGPFGDRRVGARSIHRFT